ncbi:hypothetical protein NDI76_21095 [Halogeometricum sp. S1BR25-6]|jgi:hypothetical protein|uniref:Uncharacterized protein n=1 Tax=Halogeometricum salsisoli TaxID=2950536 RepID=A0ABU2GK84_9EURY|nr:hypothetical protein [Halogeometricum sp. S1BR25-6]MDS0301233.1 hypothetical protein [Halogeometricum sp. S1BR25-6]
MDISTQQQNRPLALWALIATIGVLGVSGLAGGGQFILAPSGRLIGISPTLLAGSPFESYLVPGLVLFSLLGVFPLVVVYGLFRRKRWAWPAAIAVGVALVVWVLVEGVVIGFGKRLQYPHLVQGVVIVSLAVLPSVRAALR